jgi:hypothetical protein
MFGATVKPTPLLATLDTVTTRLPVRAAAGTLTVMLVALQADAVPAEAPPKVTVLVPWLAPKPVPVMVNAVPIAPEGALKPLMFGGVTTVKLTTLLERAPTVTTTLPVTAPAGTVTPMLVGLQLENVVAAVPPNVTELPVWLPPKFVPVMVICVPTAPVFWLRLVIFGATVKATPLLATLDTVTSTLPVRAVPGTLTVILVAVQVEAAPADAPPKVTVLVR